MSLKIASLSRTLLVAKSRSQPNPVIDKIMSDVRLDADASPSPVGELVVAKPRSRPTDVDGSFVPPPIVSSMSAAADVSNMHETLAKHFRVRETRSALRHKISARLASERYFRIRLMSFHLGVSVQDIIIRALDRYIDHVAPELRQATPIAGIAERMNAPDTFGQAAVSTLAHQMTGTD